MTTEHTPDHPDAMRAVARVYHAYFTGLMLTVVTRRSAADAAKWVFHLFRHQHHEKFLSSFEKLGLTAMPHAVACAAYHYLSNSVGGVGVEFMRESDRKAWVRFVPPRWAYPGAAICGIPSEVSRAMLEGWYAQNGVSLGNPRLGFVCTAQTTDGQHGLAGYFLEHERELNESRLSALEKTSQDYEARLRALQESATQFKLLASLATGGGLLSIIALIKTLSGQ